MTDGRRVEIIPETDSRFILLRIDRFLLVLFLTVLVSTVAVHTFGIVSGIKSDDRIANETKELRRELDSAQRIIDNANAIARGAIEFQRCAFLIEPDIKKTEEVLDVCIERADLPDD